MFNEKQLICVISFIDLLAVGLTFPLLYPHLRTLGASHSIIGIFGATYSGLQVFSGPIIGSWSDLRGRKFVAFITLSLSAICYLLIGLTNSFSVLYLLRIILGFVKHTQTLCKAIIADVIPKKEHAQVYGFSTAIGFLGFVVGPIIGGHLIEFSNGFMYVSILTSLLFLINIGLFLNIKTSNEHQVLDDIFILKNIKKEVLKSIIELKKLDWNSYWDVFSLRFLFGFGISVYFANQSLHIQEKYNLSLKAIGYIISFMSTIGLISGLLLGYVTNKFYKNDVDGLKRLLHSFITITICFCGLHFAPNLILFLCALIPFGISSSILRIISMEVILNRSHNQDRGSLAGASNSIMSISRFVSPIVSGIWADVFGENTVMLFAFIPSLLGTLLCSGLMYKNVVGNKLK